MPYQASGTRRAFPRMSREIPVQVVRPDRGSRAVPAVLVDISQNGLSLMLDEPLNQGEWVVVQPGQKGAGYGAEVSAIAEKMLPCEPPRCKQSLRFPEPIEYSIMQLFM